MPVPITMPQLSDTMAEGTLVKWHKRPGDPVKSGEKIADIETDKATMEMEAYESGLLAAVVAEGSKIPVGGVLGVIAVGGEDLAAAAATLGNAAPAAAAASAPAAAAAQQAGGTAVAVVAVAPPPAAPAANGAAGRIFVSPLAKRVAADKGIDLATIRGTGPNGRIVQADVLAAAANPAAPAAPATTPAAATPARVLTGTTEKIPLDKMRLTIAQRLQQSKQTLPHFYQTIDIDLEAVAALRERVNAQLEKEKIRISIADFIAKAVASALKQNPALNATFDGSTITRHGDVNLGMAVALPNGLIVPVLRGIDQMGLKEIRQRSAELVDRARAQRLKREELSGATFTVSNLGTYGIKEFSAIINPPEVGILAIGTAEKRPVVRDNQIVPRLTMSLTLSADHRVVDGAVAAQFMASLRHLLEEPGLMLV